MPTDIVNLQKEGTTPLDLIKRFDSEDDDSEDKLVINKDINIERIPCDISVSALDFNILTEDGKLTIERNNIVRYLKAKRIVFIGTVPFIFDGCTYKKIDTDAVARIIYNAVDEYDVKPFPTNTMIKDIIAKLRVTSLPEDIPIPPGWDEEGLYDPSELIPFDNGLYNYVHDEFLRFSPNVFITYQLGGMYNPRITEHPVEEIYKKILPDPDTRRFFYEIVGYSLFSDEMFPPAIFVIYGPGHTGKTALQKAVTSLAGFDNVSSLDLTQLSGEFTTVGLLGKLINICGETGSKQSRFDANIDGELLKRLSDGQAVTVRELFGKPFEIRNRAKLWFITNTIPDFGDNSSGIYRRVYIIPCRVEQDDRDRIYDKLTDPYAISWLGNKALEGYRDFLANDRQFHVSSECAIESRAYKKQDSIMDFLEEKFGTTSKSVIPDKLDGWLVSDLYREYSESCKAGGGVPMKDRKFGEKLRNEYNMNTISVHTYKADGTPTTKMQYSNPRKHRI